MEKLNSEEKVQGEYAYFQHGHAHRYCVGCTDTCEFGPCCVLAETIPPKTKR